MPADAAGALVLTSTRVLLSLLIGNHSIAADHHPRSRAEVLERALRRLGAH